MPQRIAQVQEHERFRIAQELHDTVQQFLGRLPFDLDVCRAGVRTEPAETEAILQHCLVDVEETAQALRQIRNDLAPHQLEAGLSRPLQELIDRFGARTGLDMNLSFEADVDVRLSLEARHALYRVIQQALDNIRTHAHAHRVGVTLTMLDQLHFGIVDDGQGFSVEQKLQFGRHGGFGLKSMEARIAALGGELKIVSALGRGTQVIGWLPIISEFNTYGICKSGSSTMPKDSILP